MHDMLSTYTMYKIWGKVPDVRDKVYTDPRPRECKFVVKEDHVFDLFNSALHLGMHDVINLVYKYFQFGSASMDLVQEGICQHNILLCKHKFTIFFLAYMYRWTWTCLVLKAYIKI